MFLKEYISLGLFLIGDIMVRDFLHFVFFHVLSFGAQRKIVPSKKKKKSVLINVAETLGRRIK